VAVAENVVAVARNFVAVARNAVAVAESTVGVVVDGGARTIEDADTWPDMLISHAAADGEVGVGVKGGARTSDAVDRMEVLTPLVPTRRIVAAVAGAAVPSQIAAAAMAAFLASDEVEYAPDAYVRRNLLAKAFTGFCCKHAEFASLLGASLSFD
jgi:hypothetical protein